MREILVNWTSPFARAGVSVFNFDHSVTAAAQRTALQTFLTSLKPLFVEGMAWTVAVEGREFDPADGHLIGAWNEPTAKTGVGSAANPVPLADATQLLIRWKTETIRRGRFVAGRTFIPGISSANVLNGDVPPGVSAISTPAAQALITAAVGLQIWGRPILADPGIAADVTSATTWSEYAVLRRRRQ